MKCVIRDFLNQWPGRVNIEGKEWRSLIASNCEKKGQETVKIDGQGLGKFMAKVGENLSTGASSLY